MPFIGTTPAQGFASSVNKQSFTANGSTTSFTLTHPVSNANDLEVFVGNVRQEPTAAYSASGNTLDFGSGNAPPNGINLYVIYKNLAQVTTTPPDGSVGTGKIAANAVTVGKLATSGALPALDGSALTGTMTKVFHSAWTSDVAQVLANNIVTNTITGLNGQNKRRKPSDYGTQLMAKQKLKCHYGYITEKQFRNLIEIENYGDKL